MQSLKKTGGSILRWSERIFSLDMTYLAKGGVWTGIRFAVGLGASIATMVAFGNLLSKESYGTYSYLLSLASSLGFLTLTGMGPVITRAVARGQEGLLRYAVGLQLRYNVLAVATIAVVAVYYGVKGNLIFAFSLAILSIVLPLEAAYHLYEHALIGQKKFDTLALLASISTIGATAATIITLALTDNVLILICVYGVMSLGPSFIYYQWVKSKMPEEVVGEEEKIELSRSAFHITGAGIIGTLAQYADKIILFQVAGPVPLAVYSFATAGPERLKGLVKNWMSIALPRLSERTMIEIRHAFYKRIGLSIAAGAVFAGVYIVLSPILFRLLLPKYLDSIIYSQVYALGLIIIPVLVYIGNIFYSQNMLRAIYITSTGNQVLRIVLLVVLGSIWQTWGLVFGFILAQLLGALFCIFIWEKESKRLIRESK